MSRKSTRRRPRQNEKEGPIQVGSVLHKALEMVAREIAKRLAAGNPRHKS